MVVANADREQEPMRTVGVRCTGLLRIGVDSMMKRSVCVTTRIIVLINNVSYSVADAKMNGSEWCVAQIFANKLNNGRYGLAISGIRCHRHSGM